MNTIKVINGTDETTYEGIIAYKVGGTVLQVVSFTNVQTLINLDRTDTVEIISLTDEEIANGDPEFAAWYKEQEEKNRLAAEENAKQEAAA